MKVLVHLHVYYLDQVPYFLEKLSSIGGCQWDLVVTSSSLPPREESLLREFKPDVRFIQAENVGYDDQIIEKPFFRFHVLCVAHL